MSWVKLDDQFAQHPKLLAAGPIAAWFHVCALCYCARYLTDGAIPDKAIGTLMDTSELEAKPKQIASLLVEVGLWNRSENGYVIHDYLEFNPTRAQVLSTRYKRAEAGRVGGKRSGEARRSEPEANCLDGASENDEANAKQKRTPSRTPTPLTPNVSAEPLGVGVRTHATTAIEDKWEKKTALFDAYCRGVGIKKNSGEYMARMNIGLHEMEALIDRITPEKMEQLAAWVLADWQSAGIPKTPGIDRVILAEAEYDRLGGEPAPMRGTRPANRGNSRVEESRNSLSAIQAIARGEKR